MVLDGLRTYVNASRLRHPKIQEHEIEVIHTRQKKHKAYLTCPTDAQPDAPPKKPHTPHLGCMAE